MSFNNILFHIQNEIATITINRPDKLNALNKETIAEIGIAIKQSNTDELVKAIILTGAGSKAFVAGADIAELLKLNVEEGTLLSRAGHVVFNAIETSAKPVIAAVNGFALGGGCELAMACHLRVASNNAKFGQPEVNLGLVAGYGGTQRLIQLIGKSKALELHLTADMLTATEALQLGLVNYVTSPEELLPKCVALIEKIKTKSPKAIAGVIRAVNAYFLKDSNGFEVEVQEFGKCFGTADFKEGTTAFLEKRKANFKGE